MDYIKKLNFLILFCLFIICESHANGGLFFVLNNNYSKINASNSSFEDNLGVGIKCVFPTSDNICLGFGVSYSKRHLIHNDVILPPLDSHFEDDISESDYFYKLNSIDLPLELSYNIPIYKESKLVFNINYVLSYIHNFDTKESVKKFLFLYDPDNPEHRNYNYDYTINGEYSDPGIISFYGFGFAYFYKRVGLRMNFLQSGNIKTIYYINNLNKSLSEFSLSLEWKII